MLIILISFRNERRPIWSLVIFASICLALYFLITNTSDYMDSSTITTLSSSTSPLTKVFFPSITVCSRNQVRLIPTFYRFLRHFFIFRNTFWTTVNLTDRVKKKMVLENFFTGREKPLTDTETASMIDIMKSEKVQKEFCDYLIHTGHS